MTNLKIYNECPDYVFSSDETNTVIIWPDTYYLDYSSYPDIDEDGETVDCLHTAERTESGEIVEYRIYNYPMPADGAEYDEMIDDIVNDCPWDIEKW